MWLIKVENHEIKPPELEEKLKELKIKGDKNISLLSLLRFPSSKTADTLLYVDDSIIKVRTVVNMDGSLEIFIEKSREQ